MDELWRITTMIHEKLWGVITNYDDVWQRFNVMTMKYDEVSGQRLLIMTGYDDRHIA